LNKKISKKKPLFPGKEITVLKIPWLPILGHYPPFSLAGKNTDNDDNNTHEKENNRMFHYESS